MRLSYNVTGSERRSLVAAISHELNAPTNYLGAPTFAYEIGGYHIDKTGTVTGEDNRELVANLCGLHSFKAVTEEYDELTIERPLNGFRFEKTEHLKEDIMKRLEEGVRPLFETEQYKEYLKTVSRFHDYSFNNTILILLQQPDATYVAGFNKWKELGRSVNKGETGIKIIACGEKKIKCTDEKGKEKEDIQRYFFPVTVFDIAQTSGKELTLNPFTVHRLDGTVERFEGLRDALIKTADCPVIFEPMKKDGPLGYYSRQTKDIHISESLSPAQTLNVLVHEITHAKLHDDLEQIKARDAQRSTREVEAESVSFVVCERLGLDTSQNSFGYIAGWSKEKELPELKKSLQIIADTSRAISDQVLQELQKNQEKTQRENLACRKK